MVIDDHGRAVTRWSFSDDVDARLFRSAMVELAKLHRAAGAKEIVTTFQTPVAWREGEDFDAFLAAIEAGSLAPNDCAAFSAHQMGSCRMGADPATSVADGRGELHDTKGVWIGDGSAFPTAPGVNPMISIMSLAHRTAGRSSPAARRERGGAPIVLRRLPPAFMAGGCRINRGGEGGRWGSVALFSGGFWLNCGSAESGVFMQRVARQNRRHAEPCRITHALHASRVSRFCLVLQEFEGVARRVGWRQGASPVSRTGWCSRQPEGVHRRCPFCHFR